MSSWKSLLLRIGEKSSDYGTSDDVKEHIETCYGVLRRELEHSPDDVSQFLIQCAEQLPHKSPLYGTVIGLLNLENEEFIRKVVENTQTNFQDALASGNCNKIRILMRFLTVMVCMLLLVTDDIQEQIENTRIQSDICYSLYALVRSNLPRKSFS